MSPIMETTQIEETFAIMKYVEISCHNEPINIRKYATLWRQQVSIYFVHSFSFGQTQTAIYSDFK